MSLEDKFYPDDGSVLTRVDNALIKTAGAIGETYQYLTGRSYKELVEVCYKISTVGCGISIPGEPIGGLYFTAFAFKGCIKPSYQSPLEEEIEQEAVGNPKWSGRFFRIVTSMSAGAWLILYVNQPDDVNSNYKSMMENGLIRGLSLIPLALAEYMTKSDIPQPPKKTVWKDLSEGVKRLFDEPIVKPA